MENFIIITTIIICVWEQLTGLNLEEENRVNMKGGKTAQ